MSETEIASTHTVGYGHFGTVTYEHDGEGWKVLDHVEVEGVPGVRKQRKGISIEAVEAARAKWLSELQPDDDGVIRVGIDDE